MATSIMRTPALLCLVSVLLACNSLVAPAYARPQRRSLLTHDDEIVLSVDYDGAPENRTTPHSDQILFSLTDIACNRQFNTWFVSQRCLRIIGQAQYEAIAHYSERSVGFLTGGKYRMPKHMRTLANKKTSVYHAIATVVKTLFPNPAVKASLDDLLKSISLNPDDDSMDPTTPVGLGNIAGKVVAAYSMDDGSNQDGRLGGHEYNLMPYSDYTGYEPVNSPYSLVNKSRWQPQIILFLPPDLPVVQTFKVGHACKVKALSEDAPTSFRCKTPGDWNKYGTDAYRANADAILDYNRRVAYNDTAKVMATLVDSVPTGITTFMRALAEKEKWTFDEEVRFNFAIYSAAYDTTLAVLCCKRTYDTIRPISAIRYSGLYKRVTAYVNPDVGIVDMPAIDWKQYNLGTSAEPEYPSGAVALLSSFAEVGRKVSKSHKYGVKIRFPKGLTNRDKRVPKEDILLDFPTWDSLRDFAMEGRLYGNVHFPPSVVEADRVGTEVSARVFDWAKSLFEGKV